MSLIKFNKRNRLLPFWDDEGLKSLLGSDAFFNNDLFDEDNSMPAMNVTEHDKDFEIEFAAPGFSKKDFEVTIDDNVLRVCGKKENEVEENEEHGYKRREFNYNYFERSLKLPKSVAMDQEVKAKYKDGILKLNLLKRENASESLKKVIEVN
ncbi:Hsp20/alpha crystallin family protein [Mangrovimonas sp. DI 80]|uniref:Hsp20/alpha crystallin family protein n=1 Tax=Mangrovimonas sp. DI 80 TaxID=1779330 RepID=UPI0009768047|nr:Hsp20/alpha crystallin family protein [Mangrovimonas sp. DI 80]OMP30007.1 heat-shock protein [Mangrovimonas sp. DI 80]